MSHALPFLSSVNALTPLPFVGNCLQVFSSSVFILFLYESITLELRMGHCSLITFAMFSSICCSFVSLSRAWMAGSSEFSNVIPCLSAELVARNSIFGMPSPPFLLLQYTRSLEWSWGGVEPLIHGSGCFGPWLGWYYQGGGLPGPFVRGSVALGVLWLGIVFGGVLSEHSDIVQAWFQVEPLGTCTAAQTMERCGLPDSSGNYLLLSCGSYSRLPGIGLDWRYTTNPLSA